MKNRICLIYNYAHHYRSSIFRLMDRELHIDFVFGDKYLDVKKMDYSLLTNFKKEVQNKTFLKKPLYYQKGILSLLKEDYSSFLILGETICLSTWMMLFLSKFYNKKVYLWTHGWYGKESLIIKYIKKIYFSMSEDIFLYGKYAKKMMIKENIDREKLHVIYNSLEYDEHFELRKISKSTNIFELHFMNKNPNLIFIGRLTKVKRLELLLYALNELNSQSLKFNLILIGNGQQRKELEKLVSTLKLKKSVWFFGACYDEKKLSELIYNSDLCVSPGNVGLTAIHAMSYGTPVMTHDNFSKQMPEFEAIKDMVTGTFFTYDDFKSIAINITKWISNSPDRNKTRQSCYSVIDEFYNPHTQIKTFRKYLR